MSEDLNNAHTLIGILIGVITVLTVIGGIIKAKWDSSLKAMTHNMGVTNDMDDIKRELKRLCEELSAIREEHVKLHIHGDELEKALIKVETKLNIILKDWGKP
jgi:hypothetical protein